MRATIFGDKHKKLKFQGISEAVSINNSLHSKDGYENQSLVRNFKRRINRQLNFKTNTSNKLSIKQFPS